jgi:hypothetical protein
MVVHMVKFECVRVNKAKEIISWAVGGAEGGDAEKNKNDVQERSGTRAFPGVSAEQAEIARSRGV